MLHKLAPTVALTCDIRRAISLGRLVGNYNAQALVGLASLTLREHNETETTLHSAELTTHNKQFVLLPSTWPNSLSELYRKSRNVDKWPRDTAPS